MKKIFFRILSLTMFAAGCGMLAYAAYLYIFPEYTAKIERLGPPSPILTTWQKDMICARTKPTPLFLNFYGNSEKPLIIIMLGREKEIVRTLLFPVIPLKTGTRNIARFVVLNDGNLKNLEDLDDLEYVEYMQKFDFTEEEENFLKKCVDRIFTPKFEI